MAIGFNSSGDFAKLVGSPAFALTGDTDKFTMAGWMRIKNITPGRYAYPFGIESADTDSSSYALIGIDNFDNPEFSSSGGAVDWSPVPTGNDWYYFYISGANDGAASLNLNAGFYNIASTAPIDSVTDQSATEFDVVRISLGNDSWGEWLEVDLSQVRVWTGIELSNAQLLAERNSTKAVYTTGLFADWPMTHADCLDDISGNGRTLSTGGTLTTQDEPPNNPPHPYSGPVKVAQTRVACPTSTGKQWIRTDDLGGEIPKAAILTVTWATTDGTAADGAMQTIAIVDEDGNYQCVGGYDEHNVADTDTYEWRQNTNLIRWYNLSDTVEGEAGFLSFCTNGMVLNWVTAPSSAYLLTVTFFTGVGLQTKVGVSADLGDTVDTTTNITNVGFQPDDVFAFIVPSATSGDIWQHIGYGFCHFDGVSAYTQYSIGAYRANAQANGSPAVYINNAGLATITTSAGALDYYLQASNFNSTGFDVTSRNAGANNDEVAYLALKYNGGAKSWVGLYTTPGDNIFDCNNDGGNLDEWDTIIDPDVGEINATAAAALAGSNYGIAFTIDDQDTLWAEVNHTANVGEDLRVRFYFDTTDLTMASGDYMTIAVTDLSASPWNAGVVELNYNATFGYQIRTSCKDDSNNNYVSSLLPITDGEHYIEYYIQAASSSTASDGAYRVWIDGVLRYEVTDLDIWDMMGVIDWTDFGCGSVDAGTSGTFYMDEMIANRDGRYIGPVPASSKIAPARGIVDIGHNNGNLSEYTSTVDPDGDELNVTTAAALAGDYGLAVTIDDLDVLYGVYDLGTPNTSGTLRCRFYIDPNSITMATSDSFVVAQLSSTAGVIARIYLWKSATSYQLYYSLGVDSGYDTIGSLVDISDGPHYVEFEMTRATSDVASDGTAQWWIDGVFQASESGKDNYDRFVNFDYIWFGCAAFIDAGTSGTFYLDELVINDDGRYIGPVKNTPIININHDDGDKADYTSLVDPDTDELNITAAAALANSKYGMAITIDDQDSIYGEHVLVTENTSGVARWRFYIDPNGLTMSNDNYSVVTALLNTSSQYVANVWLYKTGSGYNIYFRIYNDAGGNSASSFHLISDDEHYVELLLTRATGESTNDGSLQCWIDGTSVQTLSGVDNYTRFSDLKTVQMGFISVDAGVSGTLYLDELVVNDDGTEIGPVETDHSISTIGFEPGFLMMLPTLAETIQTAYANDLAGSIGVITITADTEYTNITTSEDTADPTNTQSLSDDRAIVIPYDDGTLHVEGTLKSFDIEGATFTYTNKPVTPKIIPTWAVETRIAKPPVIAVPNLRGWQHSNPINTQFSVNRNSWQSDGLVFWLPFANQSLIDLIGGRTLTRYNSPVFVPTERGLVMSFDDASNQYLSGSGLGSLTMPLTMMVWYYSDAEDNDQSAFFISDGTTTHYYMLNVAFSGANYLRAFIGDAGGGVFATTTTEGSINTWQHICGVYTSSTLRAAYLNGGGKGTETTNKSPNAATNVEIGRTVAGTQYMSGMIADARIYNRALSDAEVYEIYRNGRELYLPVTSRFYSFPTTGTALIPAKLPPRKFQSAPNTQFTINKQSKQADGLVAWWPLEHGGNTSHQDRADQGGLMNVKEPHSSFSRMVVDADHGWVYEYNYDGSTDAGLQTASNPPPLTGMSKLTVSIWVKTDWSEYSATEFPYFFAKSGWADNREWRIRYEDSEDVVRFHVSHNGTDTYAAVMSSVSSTVDTGWHHWVGTYDTDGGSNNVKLYLDGVEVGTPATTTGALYSGTLPVSIGASGDASPNSATWVRGRMSGARIYDRALSAAEVYDLYVNRWDLYKPVVSAIKITPPTYITGEVTWGHDTSVIEANIRDFTGDWTGTGSITGSGDSEQIVLDSGEYMISPVVYTGVDTVTLYQNLYDETGDDVDLDYRTGATSATCQAASWSNYTVPFSSSGYVQIRLTSTL